jgi:hypothetical protein
MAPHLAPVSRNQLMDLEGLLLKGRPAAQGESPLVRARRSTAYPTQASGGGGPSPPLGSSPLWAPRGSVSSPASGTFIAAKYHDIFRDPRVKRWSMSDKALYVVWWSFRPPFCKECGVTDLWTPSPEDEYRCGHCGAGAGSTAQSDTVEEFGGGGEDADDDSDGEQQDAGGDAGDPSASFTAAGLYHFFLSWMMALPKALLETNLPRGQDVPLVLRTAFELSLVVALPSMPPSGVYLVRGASLFLGLAAHGFNVPFPVFVRGGTSHAVQQHRIVAAASEKSLMQSSGLLAVASRSEELQWLDVESVAAQVGLSLPDFFESMTAAEQYLQNTMTLLAEDGIRVPSLLWRLDRVPGRLDVVASMKASLSAESMSPEHRAAVVAVELSRQLELSESNPLAEGSTSPDQLRVRDWYEAMMGAEEFAHILQPARHRPSSGGSSEGGGALFPPVSTPSLLEGSTVLLPDSKLADMLLKLFAFCFRIPRLAMCEMVMHSGCYSGATTFYTVLQQAAVLGRFDVLPLFRRLSPLACSPWFVVHTALHSEDRLPLLAALGHVATATVREREAAAGKLVQRICRKHGSNSKYLFNYCLRCVDPEEKHMHGLYVCTYVSSACSVFTCIRSGRKTITYHTSTKTISLCYLGSKERVVEANRLAVLWVGPMVAAVESHTAKFVMDCSRSGLHLSEWSVALQKLHVCSALRKASRTSPFPTHCLNTIRDLLASTSALADNTSDAQLSGSGGTYAFSEAVVARQVGRDVFSLVHPSLLRGCSDDKVLRWYHSLYALAEVQSDVFHSSTAQASEGDLAEVTPAQFQSRIFGVPGRAKHRLDDAEVCLEDLLRCVKAVKSGVRADISEEVRKRSMRKRRREEELKKVVFDKDDDH